VRPALIGIDAGSVLTTSGHSRSFHECITVITASAASAGLTSGSITEKKIRNRPAPSRTAASSNSFGIVAKNWRSRNVPNAENRPGRISAGRELSSPSADMIWYWGSTSSCLGTISTDRNSANSTSRPRNSSRANAYAPSEQNASWPIVTAPATTSEFTSCVPNGMVAKTSAKFDHSHSRGSRVGGTVAVSGCDLSAVSTCQTNGPIIATEPATSTAWVATEPSSDPRALRGARRRSDIVDPPALQPELDEREGADQQHEQEGQRGGRALVRLDEGLLVEQRDDRLRRAERRVRGGRRAHDVDEVEDLQRRDDVDDGAEEDRRAEHRQRDAPEPLPGVRAVDLRGLPVLLRDRLDARDEDHQVVADLGPDLDDADREQRRVGVGHPVRAGDP